VVWAGPYLDTSDPILSSTGGHCLVLVLGMAYWQTVWNGRLSGVRKDEESYGREINSYLHDHDSLLMYRVRCGLCRHRFTKYH
jgi:hypothetical protein